MKIYTVDVEKDIDLMKKIVEYEDSKDIFGDLSIGKPNIFPISKYGITYVGFEKDEIISVVEILASFEKKLAYIYGISVKKEYRKKGIATKMLDYTLKSLRNKGIHEVELLVSTKNEIAQKLYKNFNFKNIKEYINPLFDGQNKYLYKANILNHYYTSNDTDISNIKEIKYKGLTLFTSSSVFSKNKVDFGTDLLINTFIEEEKNVYHKILDYGCGYGAVGISLAKLINAKTYFYDISLRALELTKMNIEKNKIIEYEILDTLNDISNKFTAILLNPPIRTGKDNVFSMYDKAYNMLEDNGKLYIVIQTKQGYKSTFKKLKEKFKICENISINNGYRILKAVK